VEMHFDVRVDNLDQAEAEAIQLGRHGSMAEANGSECWRTPLIADLAGRHVRRPHTTTQRSTSA